MLTSSYGELTGIPKSALQRYVTGETAKIPLDRIESIASATDKSATWIMGWEEDNDNIISAYKIKTKKFPLLGSVACGERFLTRSRGKLI